MANNSGRFHFDGGAATYVGTAILGALITIGTLGICYPFAVVLMQRWRAKHTYIDGHRLTFTGSAVGLFGNWIKWLALCVITLGIYGFWVAPRIQKWKTEHTDFDPTWQRSTPPSPAVAIPAATTGTTTAAQLAAAVPSQPTAAQETSRPAAVSPDRKHG